MYCTTHGFIALTPSIRTCAALRPCPLKENCIDFEGLLVPPLSCPLGGIAGNQGQNAFPCPVRLRDVLEDLSRQLRVHIRAMRLQRGGFCYNSILSVWGAPTSSRASTRTTLF